MWQWRTVFILLKKEICQSLTADKDAHRPADKRPPPIRKNPFQISNGRKKPPKPPEWSTSPKSNEDSSSPTTSNSKVSKHTAFHSSRTGARKDFLKMTAAGLVGGQKDEVYYSDPESLPSLEVAYQNFQQVYSKYLDTMEIDRLREREYGHLGDREHVCMDYSGFGLFSHWQQIFQRATSSFNLAYISANLPTHALYGTAEEGTLEAYMRRRIMKYMNLSETDYSMVFTASRGTAYKLLAESYPFHINNRLLTVYDYESDAVSWMVATANEKGARVMNASFRWPNLRIAASDLKCKLEEKKKKKDQSAKGLFVFPVQSRVTGAKYSYQWMSQAQAYRWHVLLDASALAPKDMDSLALSLFRPEFIVTSFYKVFGMDPTGFGCLFIKNSVIQNLHNSSRARGVGMVRIVPTGPSNSPAKQQECSSSSDAPELLSVETNDLYVDAADFYVQPVSSFSGPLKQSFLDNLKEHAILDRITASGKEMNIVGFDDGSGRTSVPSEFDNESLDGPQMKASISGSEILESTTAHEGGHPVDFEDLGNHQGDEFFVVSSKGTEDGSEGIENGVGRGEIEEEEDSGPIFPLTRRHQKSNTAWTEVGNQSPVEMEDGSERGNDLWAQDETPSLRGIDGYALERIQEEEDDDGEDDFSPHQKRMSLQEAIDTDSAGNGLHAVGSPLFLSPSETMDEFGNGSDQEFGGVYNAQETTPCRNGKLQREEEVKVRSEADKLESNIMFKDDRDHALREGREVENSSSWQEGQTSPPFAQVEISGEENHHLGVSGTNGRRLQYWSSEEGSSQWANQYEMSDEGSPVYGNDYGNDGDSNDDIFDEEGPVVCNGLDHADSQGLNKTNLRLRYLINWLINALLKLQHPGQNERPGLNLVHIYGPEVHFDRGASVAFNVFDWNGMPVKPELIQRLADRNNISLGLGTLCNVIYPEGSEDLPGLWPTDIKSAQRATSNTSNGPQMPRTSNANKHDRYRPLEIPVVTASLGFVSTFEDVYRLWAFVSHFLDADFVSRELQYYHSLNQEMVVL